MPRNQESKDKVPSVRGLLADSGKTTARIPAVRERRQAEVATAVVAVDEGSVAAPDRAEREYEAVGLLGRVGEPPVEELDEGGCPISLLIQVGQNFLRTHVARDVDVEDLLDGEISVLEREILGSDVRVHIGREPTDRQDPGEDKLPGHIGNGEDDGADDELSNSY